MPLYGDGVAGMGLCSVDVASAGEHGSIKELLTDPERVISGIAVAMNDGLRYDPARVRTDMRADVNMPGKKLLELRLQVISAQGHYSSAA